MAPGGRRVGAGRKAGSKSRATIEKETFGRAVAEQAAANGDSPLEYMLNVMRDAKAAQTRRDAMAIAAYLHARPRGERASGRALARTTLRQGVQAHPMKFLLPLPALNAFESL